MDWSLTSELNKLANSDNISESLKRLGLIDSTQNRISVVGNAKDWFRGGSETYIYPFSVRENDIVRKFLFKACIVCNPSGTIDQILEGWIDRRALLNKLGLSTPQLYYYGNGILIEEFIEYHVTDYILARGFDQQLIESLIFISSVLVYSGFKPINPFFDLRSRGEDIVFIDFGEDLGSYGNAIEDKDSIIETLLAQIGSWGYEMAPTFRKDILKRFHVLLNTYK